MSTTRTAETTPTRAAEPAGAGMSLMARVPRVRLVRLVLRRWLSIFLLSGLAGAVYKLEFGHGPVWPGMVYGLFIGGAVVGFQRGMIWPWLWRQINGLPTMLHVPAAELAYVGLILVGHLCAGLALWPTGYGDTTFASTVMPSPLVMLYSVVASAILVSALRIRDLIGTDVLFNLLIGRYHRPVQEERIFLFIDLMGSTAYAERHGDLRAQAFLGAIFAALAEPVRRHRGSIDDYVGDMALVTWPLRRGVHEARCVACVFEFLALIERNAPQWQARFGQVPAFRAALHGGAVVTAEVGVDRHKISYFGDVVNTTGRMEALSKTLGVGVLISGDLLDRLPALPAGIGMRPLGTHALKGRGQQLRVSALEPNTLQ